MLYDKVYKFTVYSGLGWLDRLKVFTPSSLYCQHRRIWRKHNCRLL